MGSSDLRAAAQQALEALEDMLGWQSLAPQTIQKAAKGRAAALKAALAEPVRGFEMRRCPRCWEPMFSPHHKPLTVTDLQEALVYTNLIDRDAIDDPEGYDEGSTLAQIDALHQRLTA